jgi:hypothetical protein
MSLNFDDMTFCKTFLDSLYPLVASNAQHALSPWACHGGPAVLGEVLAWARLLPPAALGLGRSPAAEKIYQRLQRRSFPWNQTDCRPVPGTCCVLATSSSLTGAGCWVCLLPPSTGERSPLHTPSLTPSSLSSWFHFRSLTSLDYHWISSSSSAAYCLLALALSSLSATIE